MGQSGNVAEKGVSAKARREEMQRESGDEAGRGGDGVLAGPD